jgi:hypothetical protein
MGLSLVRWPPFERHLDIDYSGAQTPTRALPWLRHLRQQLAARVHFWPFDGRTLSPVRSIIAKVYLGFGAGRCPAKSATPTSTTPTASPVGYTAGTRVIIFSRRCKLPNAHRPSWKAGASASSKFPDAPRRDAGEMRHRLWPMHGFNWDYGMSN